MVITRPKNFSYQAGDYIFVNIPAIAKYEWHPFTISSAPEQQGIIWLHVRAVGTWTKKLHNFFKARNEQEKKGWYKKYREEDWLAIRYIILYRVTYKCIIMNTIFFEMLPIQLLKEPIHHHGSSSNSIHPSTLYYDEDRHPLEPSHSPEVTSTVSNKALIHNYQGQDFSHLISKPVVINVQIKDEEDKGAEVIVMIIYVHEFYKDDYYLINE